MTSRAMEAAVGLFVILGVAALFVLAMQVSNLGSLQRGEGYRVTAYFANAGGLSERAPVRAAGVTVGRVVSIGYDQARAEAAVTMEIERRYSFSVDTAANIYTSGLLGEQYVALLPGAESENLEGGDEITLTQSALVLEELIGRMFLQAAEGGRGDARPGGN